ncbi:MAG: hypothetical protein VCB26_10655, partial [Candidatus Hydrogenedentota bacterium]
RAVGFGSDAIYRMLLTEYSLLLAAGLFIGIVAASVSTIPALFATESNINLSIQLRLATLILIVCVACMTFAVRTGLRTADLFALRSE